MPGGKSSRPALFEDVDFTMYNDGDKTMAFMTDKDRLPLWIRSLDNHYKRKTNNPNEECEIDWTISHQQAKLLAQVVIPYEAHGTVKLSNLAISFYLTTHRVLLQGNQCGNWCRSTFPTLKASVEEAWSNTDEKESLDAVIADLVTNMSDCNVATAATDTDTSDTSPPASNPSIPSQGASPQRRSLPSPPPAHDQKTIEYLKSSISKIIEENVSPKETLHDVTTKVQDLQHSLTTTTAELQQSNLEIKECRDLLEKERSLREKTDEINKKHVQHHEEQSKTTSQQLEKMYARIRAVEEKQETTDERCQTLVENQASHQHKSTSDEIQKRIEDIEKELNSIQDKYFNGELVTGSHHNPSSPREQISLRDTGRATPEPADRPREKIFRAIKLFGTVILGDSNTRGLDKRRLAMGIASISGATLDSAINYFRNADAPDESIQRVIFHLGTNNCNTESVEDIKAKLGSLQQLAHTKYPKSNIAFCKIPGQFTCNENNTELNSKINEINDFIKAMEGLSFIDINANEANLFTRDGKHYNKHGLAILAGAIKRWAKANGHIPTANPNQ
ncbi:hypothetical protein ACROYT_G041815, partial [Oculina patagonica]